LDYCAGLGAAVFTALFTEADGVALANAEGSGDAMTASTRFMRALKTSNIEALLLRIATMPPWTIINTPATVGNAAERRPIH